MGVDPSAFLFVWSQRRVVAWCGQHDHPTIDKTGAMNGYTETDENFGTRIFAELRGFVFIRDNPR